MGKGLAKTSSQRYADAELSIREAFLQLLGQYEFREITASMIVGAAHVNRSTFYAHYQDKYALMDAIEAELVDKLESITLASPLALARYGLNSEENLRVYFSSIAAYLREYGPTLVTLVDRGNRVITRGIRSSVEDMVDQANSYASLRFTREATVKGMLGMMIGLTIAWVEGGCRNPDLFVEALVDASQYLPDVFFFKEENL